MRNLNNQEIININGGHDCPTVSTDPNVQNGYHIGWHIGHALGEAVDMMGNVLDTLNPFNWFD